MTTSGAIFSVRAGICAEKIGPCNRSRRISMRVENFAYFAFLLWNFPTVCWNCGPAALFTHAVCGEILSTQQTTRNHVCLIELSGMVEIFGAKFASHGALNGLSRRLKRGSHVLLSHTDVILGRPLIQSFGA